MYASNSDQKEINGFIVIDKPKGPTSHQIDAWVREVTGEKRVGHIGTLDPNVSGVLVMALGKATMAVIHGLTHINMPDFRASED